MYLRSSDGGVGDGSHLVSPVINTKGPGLARFYYYMRGDVSSLTLSVSDWEDQRTLFSVMGKNILLSVSDCTLFSVTAKGITMTVKSVSCIVS